METEFTLKGQRGFGEFMRERAKHVSTAVLGFAESSMEGVRHITVPDARKDKRETLESKNKDERLAVWR